VTLTQAAVTIIVAIIGIGGTGLVWRSARRIQAAQATTAELTIPERIVQMMDEQMERMRADIESLRTEVEALREENNELKRSDRRKGDRITQLEDALQRAGIPTPPHA